MTFDATDKKFQVSDEFPPDKESMWHYPADQDGWMHAHNAIRREIKLMIEALEAMKERGNLEEWQAEFMKKAWCDVHYTHIMNHHSNEDDLFVPFFKERFHYPDKCVADHEELVNQLNRVDELIKSLGKQEGDSVDQLLKEMKHYQEIMLPHLKQEEDECLPLQRAYFTPKEIGVFLQKILSESPKAELGSFVKCMGADNFRNIFMKQEGIPCFVWYLQFSGCLKAFEKEFTKPIDALISGEKPKK
jgi:hemerythrin-like domain-containing protein